MITSKDFIYIYIDTYRQIHTVYIRLEIAIHYSLCVLYSMYLSICLSIYLCRLHLSYLTIYICLFVHSLIFNRLNTRCSSPILLHTPSLPSATSMRDSFGIKKLFAIPKKALSITVAIGQVVEMSHLEVTKNSTTQTYEDSRFSGTDRQKKTSFLVMGGEISRNSYSAGN